MYQMNCWISLGCFKIHAVNLCRDYIPASWFRERFIGIEEDGQVQQVVCLGEQLKWNQVWLQVKKRDRVYWGSRQWLEKEVEGSLLWANITKDDLGFDFLVFHEWSQLGGCLVGMRPTDRASEDEKNRLRSDQELSWSMIDIMIIRNIQCLVSSMLLLATIINKPSTFLLSSGRITPSSHNNFFSMELGNP